MNIANGAECRTSGSDLLASSEAKSVHAEMEETMSSKYEETIHRLREMQAEILEMMYQARSLLRDVEDRSVLARAEAYWIPTIESMAGGENGNPYDTSIRTTLEELEELDEEEDEDDGAGIPFESMTSGGSTVR